MFHHLNGRAPNNVSSFEWEGPERYGSSVSCARKYLPFVGHTWIAARHTCLPGVMPSRKCSISLDWRGITLSGRHLGVQSGCIGQRSIIDHCESMQVQCRSGPVHDQQPLLDDSAQQHPCDALHTGLHQALALVRACMSQRWSSPLEHQHQVP